MQKRIKLNGDHLRTLKEEFGCTMQSVRMSLQYVFNSEQATSINVGYIDVSSWYNITAKWLYFYLTDEDIEFKDTAAHEIGHTILKAYGGTFFSYGHKGSVNTVFQNQKSSAPKFPLDGEIDIMPYHKENELGKWYRQPNYYKRRVAVKKDALSLIWLTKINLK